MRGSAIAFGNRKPSPVLAVFYDMSTSTSASDKIVGTALSNNRAEKDYDAAVFSYSGGVLTCKKAGRYRIQYFAGGDHNTAGYKTVVYSFYKNQTAIVPETSYSGSASTGNYVEMGEVTVDVLPGDTLFMNFRSGSSPTGIYFRAGYIITPYSGE